jgi:hypothetical protein
MSGVQRCAHHTHRAANQRGQASESLSHLPSRASLGRNKPSIFEGTMNATGEIVTRSTEATAEVLCDVAREVLADVQGRLEAQSQSLKPPRCAPCPKGLPQANTRPDPQNVGCIASRFRQPDAIRISLAPTHSRREL